MLCVFKVSSPSAIWRTPLEPKQSPKLKYSFNKQYLMNNRHRLVAHNSYKH